jgi:hypothetical protein
MKKKLVAHLAREQEKKRAKKKKKEKKEEGVQMYKQKTTLKSAKCTMGEKPKCCLGFTKC